MPSTSGTTVLQRYLKILEHLPRYPGKTTVQGLLEILENRGIHATKRGIQRDLETLSQVLPITHSEEGKGNAFWWYWMEDAQTISFPAPNIEAALSMVLVEKHLDSILPPDMLRVMRTLLPRMGNFFHKAEELGRLNRLRTKVEFVPTRFELKPPTVCENVHATVLAALEQGKQICVKYRSMSDEDGRDIRLSPLSLVYKPPVTYLVATAYRYTEPRHYCMHRIIAAEMLNSDVVEPRGYSLHDYIDSANLSFRRGDKIHLRLRVCSSFVRFFEETQLSDDQRIRRESEEFSLLSASVLFSQDMVNWLLGFSEWVEVLEPKTVRDEFTRIISAQIAKYHL